MRNIFPNRPSGAPLHTLSKVTDVPVGFVPTPYLMQYIALLAVAEGWLLIDIGWFVLFCQQWLLVWTMQGAIRKIWYLNLFCAKDTKKQTEP